jgi:CHAT domain-containing protein
MDLTWEEDAPSTVVAEEDSAPAAEESAPLPQAETEAPAVEATLSEASIIEGEYTTQTQSSSRSSHGHRRRLIHISSINRGRSRGKHHPRSSAR